MRPPGPNTFGGPALVANFGYNEHNKVPVTNPPVPVRGGMS
jgi:hypothetical protein